MDCRKVGELIQKLRKERGWTQKYLADKMNISDRTVSKWERGLGLPDVGLLKNLSDIRNRFRKNAGRRFKRKRD